MDVRDESSDWARLEPEDLGRLDAWLALNGARWEHRGWFEDGYSQRPVGLVATDGKSGPGLLVVKVCATLQHAQSLGDAWTKSNSKFRKRHLLKRRGEVALDKTWLALFRVAGGSLVGYGALNQHLEHDDFPELCRRVVASIVVEWNRGSLPRAPRMTVGSFLAKMIGKRLHGLREWAESRAIDTTGRGLSIQRSGWGHPLTNPFLLLSGERADHSLQDLLVGRAHGDLSGRNIRVPQENWHDSDDYVLIDADRFASDAPLARDPMHLIVALALDWIAKLDPVPRSRNDLVNAVVAPPGMELPTSVRAFHDIALAIKEASAQEAIRRDLYDAWREHCLLSLVGAGLVHVGRDFHPDGAREWCFDLAAVAAQAYLAAVEERVLRSPKRATEPHGPRPGVSYGPSLNARPPAPDGEMLNHCLQRQQLRSRLADGPWGVIIVQGSAGVGKTMLVQTVLDNLHKDTSIGAMHLYQHEPTLGARFDAKTLIDAIAGDTEPAAAIRFGESSLSRLTATIETIGDKRVIVVVEGAERLLQGDGHELFDLDLDEALEALTLSNDHRIAVVFITCDLPTSSFEGTWPAASVPIMLPKLPYPDFVTLLADPDSARDGFSALQESTRRDLYRRLDGNPRRVQLLKAVRKLADHGNAAVLARTLASMSQAAIAQSLTTWVVDGLTPIRRNVLAALAAYRAPVGRDAVVALLGQQADVDQIDGVLELLVEIHLARRTVFGHYYVPSDDADWMLDGAFRDLEKSEEKRCGFLLQAAAELRRLEVEQPREFNDLEFHFAELNALLRAGRVHLAYGVMHEIAEILTRWNCADQLLSQRVRIVGQLDDIGLEMANDNELGALYAARGRFDESRIAFERAERYAQALGHAQSRAKLQNNVGTLYWQQNDTRKAADRYNSAYTEALRIGDPEILMGSLEGLADCHRRHGEYELALRHGTEALSLAAAPDFPETATAQGFARAHRVNIALKMARWYGELGRLDEARTCMREAFGVQEIEHDDWLRASCLDGRADLSLYAGNVAATMEDATAAINLAARLHDPITLLQARTTMCLAHLVGGSPLPAAFREIERAVRHRREGRSLIAVALQALVARLEGRTRDSTYLFDMLLDEATARTDRDGRDFVAWDYVGFARSGKAAGGGSIDRALEAFGTARMLTPHAPGYVTRLRVMVEKLGAVGNRRDQVAPITELLATSSSSRRLGG